MKHFKTKVGLLALSAVQVQSAFATTQAELITLVQGSTIELGLVFAFVGIATTAYIAMIGVRKFVKTANRV